MNRRSLLAFIGLAPFVPVAAKATERVPISSLVPFEPFRPDRGAWAITGGPIPGGPIPTYPGLQALFGTSLVCENHRDKAWPEECDCGPGMRYGDTLRS
jgi:hypothetical protein